MPLPKAKVLQSTANLARNNDWVFAQTQAPSAGPGAISEELIARIAPGQLPEAEETPVTGAVAGYTIEQTGRHKTVGTITFTVVEAADGTSAEYFEKLKALNNPRDSSGGLTGVQFKEEEKEGEYTITQQTVDGKTVKSYKLIRAVVRNVKSNELSKSEEAEFVEYTITLHYKDFVTLGANGQVLS
jgi:hypothetical protein